MRLRDLEEKTGYSLKTISNFENGVYDGSDRLIAKLAAALGVSAAEIMGSDVRYETPQSAPLLMTDLPVRRKVPVVSWAAGGLVSGVGLDYGDLAGQIEEEIQSETRDPNAYGLIVEGESMTPEYMPGDRIVVSPNSEARNHDVVVARLNESGAVLLKRFKRTGPEGEVVVLESTNPNFKTLEYKISDFRFIHPVVEMYRKRRR